MLDGPAARGDGDVVALRRLAEEAVAVVAAASQACSCGDAAQQNNQQIEVATAVFSDPARGGKGQHQQSQREGTNALAVQCRSLWRRLHLDTARCDAAI